MHIGLQVWRICLFADTLSRLECGTVLVCEFNNGCWSLGACLCMDNRTWLVIVLLAIHSLLAWLKDYLVNFETPHITGMVYLFA